MEMAAPDREDLALGLKPGDPQYRAYVGPPEDDDLIAAMTFNLLTTLGLRQHHSLLDIVCASLRIGRLLIPYLNRGKYFGVEPNEWLVNVPQFPARWLKMALWLPHFCLAKATRH